MSKAGMEITWRWFEFDAFDPHTLYAYLRLRQQVFVIEQACIYPDIDDLDQPSLHLLGFDAAGTLQACLRLVPPGLKYPQPSMGRVVIAPAARGTGIGHRLVAEALRKSDAHYPGLGHQIGAQAHLAGFYGQHGFTQLGDAYDEDGILHIDMIRPAE
ncbi:GNAT family N-acetyltransferase [Andreprevotia chitinilytica]|uniref:GNAT family N-acetyltransferase n=1 Tax=Andreprevotia chitinilytica TaxID=396808 RepID=UPI001FE081C9|nr:GNAT family N-acetyltransferase [Andreprevotia chitinilytica]